LKTRKCKRLQKNVIVVIFEIASLSEKICSIPEPDIYYCTCHVPVTTGQTVFLLQSVLSFWGLRIITSIGRGQRTVWTRKKVCFTFHQL